MPRRTEAQLAQYTSFFGAGRIVGCANNLRHVAGMPYVSATDKAELLNIVGRLTQISQHFVAEYPRVLQSIRDRQKEVDNASAT